MNPVLSALKRTSRGLREAIGQRPALFVAVVVAVVALDIVLPPLVLSLVRKPWTYFTFNPWLVKLPEYLASGAPLSEKIGFLSRVAVFWFTADGPYGEPEWGFAVDTPDLARFLLMGVLVGAWVTLWLARAGVRSPWRATVNRGGGIVGAIGSILGLSTGPCSVVGCGAPVMPVIGLAFAGLSSGTVALISSASRISSAVVLAALALTVLYLAWSAGGAQRAEDAGGRVTAIRSAPRRTSSLSG